MGKRTYEDVSKYVESQSQHKCKVLSAKLEQQFDDLDLDVTVWNVKTDTDGAWWVVEGDTVPNEFVSARWILFWNRRSLLISYGIIGTNAGIAGAIQS